MLNPFPELLNLGLLAPFILRLVVGVIFIDLGILKFRGEKNQWIKSFETLSLQPAKIWVPVYGIIQLVGGVLILIGLWTQIAALVFALFSFAEWFIEWKDAKILKRDFVFYILIFAICVSLLFSGAGFFAFDLPL